MTTEVDLLEQDKYGNTVFRSMDKDDFMRGFVQLLSRYPSHETLSELVWLSMQHQYERGFKRGHNDPDFLED